MIEDFIVDDITLLTLCVDFILMYKIFLKIDHNNNMKPYISGIADEISYFNKMLIL